MATGIIIIAGSSKMVVRDVEDVPR